MKKNMSHVIFDQKDFPISHVRLGVMEGAGLDVRDASHKPLIAIANSQTEFNPGHIHLDRLAGCAREGVLAAGGIPLEFNVPAPCDGITEGHAGMKFILPQRELIADTVETYIRSMRFDGIVVIASCDKIIPGMLMAAARLDLPTVFVTGGPGEMAVRQQVPNCSSINLPDHTVREDQMGCITSGSCGACEVMGTANTFQCMAEVLGLALPGSAVVPAYAAERARIARRSGALVMDLVEQERTARRFLTGEALENSLMVSQAIGGSTNAALHLPALARELGLNLPLSRFNDFSTRVPTLCAIAPNGPFGVLDLFRAGGVPAVMKRISDDLHLSARNVTGQTAREIVDAAEIKDPEVIPDRSNPHFFQGGTVALFGNLAPQGAVVKQSAVARDMMRFSGPARVFESEETCLEVIRANGVREGEVLVIRNEGPKGAPGMPETLAVTLGLSTSGLKQVALITDGRFSGATSGPCIGHVSPEAAAGGPIAALRDGDEIVIDIPGRTLDVLLDHDEIRSRLLSWQPKNREIPPGFMRRYVRYVSSAAKGAYLD